jgi:hypothetical protein
MGHLGQINADKLQILKNSHGPNAIHVKVSTGSTSQTLSRGAKDKANKN